MTGPSFALLLLAQAASPPPADPLAADLAAARALITEGRPAAAIEKLSRLASDGSATDPRVAQLLGVAYFHADDHRRAIAQLQPVVDRLPAGSLEQQETVQVLGLSHYLAGHIAEAIPFLERTRAVSPDNAELGYALGMAYIQTRQADKARATWAAAFSVPADSAAAHLFAAQMMVRAGLDELAEPELKQALAKDPRLPHAHFLLGQTALFRGRLDEAVSLLRREIEINPGDATAFYRLGDAYLRQQKADEAIVALQKSTWLNPFFSGPYILLGRAYMTKREPGSAEGNLRRAVEYDPNNRAAHYLLGQVLQQTGREEEARREFETAERLGGPVQP